MISTEKMAYECSLTELEVEKATQALVMELELELVGQATQALVMELELVGQAMMVRGVVPAMLAMANPQTPSTGATTSPKT